MGLILNQILTPGLTGDILENPHRILAFDLETDLVWCIGLPRRNKEGKLIPYVPAPKVFNLSRITLALETGELKQAAFVAPGHWSMSDKDYVAEVQCEEEKERRRNRIKNRDFAWSIIEPLIGDVTTATLVQQLAGLRPAMVEAAEKNDVDLTTVYRLLHLYLANGSTLNGLMPQTDRCGAPGKEREQQKKLGRKSNAFKRGRVVSEGYVLTSLCKERLARGFALIKQTLSPRQAYLLTCGTFWATTTVSKDGTVQTDLFDPLERPTFDQFDYWGSKLNNMSRKAKRLGLRQQLRRPTHNGGSSQDLACAVGQIGMFDSTSTDVYLTSVFSRRRKLPPMTRSIIKDLRSTLILGIYAGWHSPSPHTALQTILCGAEDKVALCARYGITITADQWPGMLCRTYLADNGEMRAEEMSEAEIKIGFGIEFARTYSGESKGDVESQHNTDHKTFDHTLVGSNLGKRRERGEPHAADSALWNHYEYMRELLLYILDYNNQEVPDLAPLEMHAAGIRPTRLNIFCWLRDHNQRADIPVDIDQLRALTLPEWPALIQYNGIILKTPDGTRNIPKARFFSEALRQDPRFEAANSSRKVVPITVRCKPEQLDCVWLPTSRGLLKVANVSSDEKLCCEGTLQDLQDYMEAESDHRDQEKDSKDLHDLETLLRREGITANAAAEAATEAKSAVKKPSKAAQRSQMRANKVAEQNEIDRRASGQGASTPPQEEATSPSKSQAAASTPPSATAPDAARASMKSFLAALEQVA